MGLVVNEQLSFLECLFVRNGSESRFRNSTPYLFFPLLEDSIQLLNNFQEFLRILLVGRPPRQFAPIPLLSLGDHGICQTKAAFTYSLFGAEQRATKGGSHADCRAN